MKDRELLALAAAAAGAELNGYRYGGDGREPLYSTHTELVRALRRLRHAEKKL